MPHEYSAENHDWDLTLRAAFELLQIGKVMDQQPRTGNMSMGFSAFTRLCCTNSLMGFTS